MQETDCSTKAAATGISIRSVPFTEVPGQSRLFLDYLAEPLALREFYPGAVASISDAAARVPEILSAYSINRDKVCEILADQGRSNGASPATLGNIDQLRRSDTVAILTGQQAGLFSGPLYTIYKAATAVKTAALLQVTGINAVPIFWAATEDHDLDEVAGAEVLAQDGTVTSVRYISPSAQAGPPVSDVPLDGSIDSLITELFRLLQDTSHTDNLRTAVRRSYSPGATIGSAFIRFITELFGRFGLIVADPSDRRFKRLASPIYAAAVKHSDKIAASIVARDKRLSEYGFHSQVTVGTDHVPLFWQDDSGVRRSLRRNDNGEISVHGTKTAFSLEKLTETIREMPERFSPGVMLRPVVQDFLFPTLCYFGGAAEIAYFAQNSEVYRILERPPATIFHRQSFTVIEAKHARTMEKFGISFTDLFEGLGGLLPRVISQYVDAGNSRLFPDAEERINTELHRLDSSISELDPTLAANLATRRRKILYHIAALRDKYYRARLRKDEETDRRLRSLFASLLPNGQLQERSLNYTLFANRYGEHFLDWIVNAVDLDDKGHRLIYL